MKKSFLSIIFLCLLSSLPLSSFAQFEGKITFTSYDVADDGSQTTDDQFTMFFASNRIFLQGENSYDVVGPIRAKGLLVRMDLQDVVIFTGKETALKISKADVNAMKQMFGGADEQSTPAQNDQNLDYSRTGKTKTIEGYNCELFVFKQEDEPGSYVEAWVTKELKTNLSEVLRSAGEISGEAIPMGHFFEEGYFPLEAVSYTDNKREGIMKATEITETSTAKKMVEIPSGIRVMGFQEFLFQQFKSRQ